MESKEILINKEVSILYTKERILLRASANYTCNRCKRNMLMVSPLYSKFDGNFKDNCRPWWKFWERQGMWVLNNNSVKGGFVDGFFKGLNE